MERHVASEADAASAFQLLPAEFERGLVGDAAEVVHAGADRRGVGARAGAEDLDEDRLGDVLHEVFVVDDSGDDEADAVTRLVDEDVEVLARGVVQVAQERVGGHRASLLE